MEYLKYFSMDLKSAISQAVFGIITISLGYIIRTVYSSISEKLANNRKWYDYWLKRISIPDVSLFTYCTKNNFNIIELKVQNNSKYLVFKNFSKFYIFEIVNGLLTPKSKLDFLKLSKMDLESFTGNT